MDLKTLTPYLREVGYGLAILIVLVYGSTARQALPEWLYRLLDHSGVQLVIYTLIILIGIGDIYLAFLGGVLFLAIMDGFNGSKIREGFTYGLASEGFI